MLDIIVFTNNIILEYFTYILTFMEIRLWQIFPGVSSLGRFLEASSAGITNLLWFFLEQNFIQFSLGRFSEASSAEFPIYYGFSGAFQFNLLGYHSHNAN